MQQTDDPDLVLSAPFSISPESRRRKIVRDLTGKTFFKQRFGPLEDKITALKSNKSAWALIALEVKARRVFLITNTIGFALFTAAGLWWARLLMWLLPMAT